MQRLLVTAALRRNDDEAFALFGGRRRIAVDPSVSIGECALFGGRRAYRHPKPDPPRKIPDRDSDRARTADHDLRPGQHGLDEDIHRALARAGVLGEAHALAFLAGAHPVRLQDVGRLNRNQPRLPIGDRLAGRRNDRAARATPADPAFGDCAVAANDCFRARLGRGRRDGAYDCRQRERFALRFQRRDEFEDVGSPVHGQILAR